METCPSGDLLVDDQLDNLVNMLNFPEAPAGLDDLLPPCAPGLGDFDGLLKAELDSDSGASRGIGFGQLNLAVPGVSGAYNSHQNLAQETDQQDQQDQLGDSKRRRRIRNAKQQELNRLAQQRYRQRKKQKYSDLQVTVEELSSKMATIAKLEEEAVELKRREAVAQDLATTRQTALLQAQVAIQQQALVIEQQRKQLSEQQQQLEVMKRSHAAAQAAASTSPRSASPAPSQQQQQPTEQQSPLCDKLVEALRAALAEVCEEQGLHASCAAQEQVLARFRRSLHSCCKEVLAPAAAVAVAGADVQAAAGSAPVPTSAGSQKVPQAAPLVSIPCC